VSEAATRHGLLVPALTTSVIVIALLLLGAWQLERRTEKMAVIARLEERLAAAPVALPLPARWRELTPADDEFRRVTLTGVIDGEHWVQVFTPASPLRKDVTGTGVWAFAPARLASGDTVVVNRGFVGDRQTAAPPEGSPVVLTGYIRFSETRGWLTPAADRGKRLWFLRDHLAMAQAFGWAEPSRLAPFYVDLESPAPSGGVPKPGPLAVSLKNDHLQYAVTWFLLASAVTIAFGFWLRGQRRVLVKPESSA
jgi:cytochrome oxidase assembly protein ShyY1